MILDGPDYDVKYEKWEKQNFIVKNCFSEPKRQPAKEHIQYWGCDQGRKSACN